MALLALPALAAPPVAVPASEFGSSFRFDLAAGSINGHALLGKGRSAVRRALGTPSAYNLGQRCGFLRYGPRSGHVSVLFGNHGHACRVTAISIASADAKEAQTGRILQLALTQLQRKIATAYAGAFRLAYSYRCARFGCRGSFKSVDGKTRLEFGPLLGDWSYIVLHV